MGLSGSCPGMFVALHLRIYYRPRLVPENNLDPPMRFRGCDRTFQRWWRWSDHTSESMLLSLFYWFFTINNFVQHVSAREITLWYTACKTILGRETCCLWCVMKTLHLYFWNLFKQFLLQKFQTGFRFNALQHKPWASYAYAQHYCTVVIGIIYVCDAACAWTCMVGVYNVTGVWGMSGLWNTGWQLSPPMSRSSSRLSSHCLSHTHSHTHTPLKHTP